MAAPELIGPATAAPLGTLEQFLGDDLTGLGSILALRRDLELLIDGFQPFGARPALLLIDIDGFGRVNSAYGRAVGDQVIASKARRLQELMPHGRAYRSGGDELVALLDPIGMIDAVAWAGHIQRELSEPTEVGGGLVAATVSIAVVMLGQRHRVDGLLRDADVAMYRAKAEGGNRVDIYNWEIDGWSSARKRDAERLEQDAKRLEKEVHELRLQNQMLAQALTVDLVTGLPNGLAFEADQQQADAWRKRSNEPYSLLRVCIDGVYDGGPYFRTPDGEKALVGVAHAVRDTIRQSDRAYVLDRGELVVLLRGSVMQQAVAASERVRAAVARLGLGHPSDPTRTLSVSIAAIEAGFRHPGPADVVAEAERLLQEALAAGGARTVWPR